MSDLHLPDDELTSLFAHFRDDARGAVRPAESAQIRAASRRRRRRQAVAFAAVVALLVAIPVAIFAAAHPDPTLPPVSTTPTTPAPSPVVAGRDVLLPVDLNGQPLRLGPWPTSIAGASHCPTQVIFDGGAYDGANGVQILLEENLQGWADVDRDGQQELIAVASCQPSPDGATDIEQVFVVAGASGSPVRMVGQVATTSADAGGIAGVTGLSDGSVRLDVTDLDPVYTDLVRHQLRTYRFDGHTFRPTGTVVDFGPSSRVIDVSVQLSPVRLGAAVGGLRHGQLSFTIANHGPALAPKLRLYITLPAAVTINSPLCQRMETHSPSLDGYECAYDVQTPPDGSGSFVLPVRAPASYHGGGTVKVALDEAAPVTPIPDTNPTNDHASAMVTVGG